MTILTRFYLLQRMQSERRGLATSGLDLTTGTKLSKSWKHTREKEVVT